MPRDNPPMRIELDRRLGLPAYRQIYERIRKAILSGNLPPGAKLPSTRSLSSQLAIARGTVELAYEMLAGEGYILGRAAAGTIVDPELAQKIALPARRAREAAPHSASPRDFPPPTPPLPFQLGVPAFDAFPRKLWSRLVARRARGLSTLAMVYQDPAGYAPLRQAIVNYLAIARGIACTVEQVFVTAGFQGAIGLITHALLGKGDAVWVEDPGYFRAREAFILAGAAPVPVPVDSDGLDVAAGIARAPAALFAMVTPSHQSPLGVSLALPRRLALLAWATSRDAWIIEDDYDSEFRYRGRPLPALKSLDAAGRVLYVGTFSKVLLPGLRLGYLVVPEGETRRFARAADPLPPRPDDRRRFHCAGALRATHQAHAQALWRAPRRSRRGLGRPARRPAHDCGRHRRHAAPRPPRAGRGRFGSGGARPCAGAGAHRPFGDGRRGQMRARPAARLHEHPGSICNARGAAAARGPRGLILVRVSVLAPLAWASRPRHVQVLP